MRSQWPVRIVDRELILAPLRFRDKKSWEEVRTRNREWLTPWEATRPRVEGHGEIPSFFAMVRYYNRDGRAGRSLTFAIWYEGRFVGLITLGGIVYGALRGAHIGYWIDQKYANRGLTTRAVIALTDFAFRELQLHRIEINLRPENAASRRVAEKAGYIFEGRRSRYLHIDGDWRDHLTYVRENAEVH
jgi:[ribosomal protein S5]-alanine N-acetyltransferase